MTPGSDLNQLDSARLRQRARSQNKGKRRKWKAENGREKSKYVVTERKNGERREGMNEREVKGRLQNQAKK